MLNDRLVAATVDCQTALDAAPSTLPTAGKNPFLITPNLLLIFSAADITLPYPEPKAPFSDTATKIAFKTVNWSLRIFLIPLTATNLLAALVALAVADLIRSDILPNRPLPSL